MLVKRSFSVSIAVMTVFVILALRGTLETALVTAVITSVITFYFTKDEKAKEESKIIVERETAEK